MEVDPFGAAIQPDFLRSLGGEPRLREREGKPVVTDGGNLIYDCRFPDGIADPEALEIALALRPGVIDTGLFLGMATAVVVAGSGGVQVLHREDSR